MIEIERAVCTYFLKGPGLFPMLRLQLGAVQLGKEVTPDAAVAALGTLVRPRALPFLYNPRSKNRHI